MIWFEPYLRGEVLRAPHITDGLTNGLGVTILRAAGSVRFPSELMLVAAMNFKL